MLLLHTCCADCSLKFMASLDEKSSFESIAWFFYNPNIHPRSEYLSRLKAEQQVLEREKLTDVQLIIPNYQPSHYFTQITPLTERTNNSKRCPLCWRLRLEAAFKHAAQHSFKAVSTTLLSSHYQDSDTIKQIGQELSQQYGIKFFVPKQMRCDLPTTGFYKQNYCGCAYSLLEKVKKKYF